MKYKLIKLLPFENSPRIGYTSEPHLSQKDEDHYWNGLWFNPENYPEFWEEVVEKDYEILSLIEGKFIYPCDKYSKDFINQLFNTLGINIHSVKRLSDGEVFTIGDKVFNEYVNNYTINKICIVNDKCMVSALYDTNNPNGSRLHYNLNNLKKAKQPLFTTEDGVDIFEGEYYYPVEKEFYFLHEKQTNHHCTNEEKFWIFSTKEKAEEYILMNKPVLSLKEIKETTTIKGLSLKKLEKLVQQKLNK